jgi:hypothetical protein
MKKINSTKLSLNRETLVTLSPEMLEGVNGGLIVPPIGPATRTIQKTIQYTRDLVTRLANCNGGPQAQ